MSPQREALISLIDELSDEQINHLVQFIHSMKAESDKFIDDLENDPMVGFFSGPTDIAEHIEDFLYGDDHGNISWTYS